MVPRPRRHALGRRSAVPSFSGLERQNPQLAAVVAEGAGMLHAHDVSSPKEARTGAAVSDLALRQLAQQLKASGKHDNFQRTLELGRWLVQHLFDGNLESFRSARDRSGFRRLAGKPGVPHSALVLYRAAAVFELNHRLAARERWPELDQSHLRSVLGLPQDEQVRLLELSVANGWTVNRLASEASRRRGPVPGRGRAALPEFVKALRSLRGFNDPSCYRLSDVDRATELDLKVLVEQVELAERLASRFAQIASELSNYLRQREAQPPPTPSATCFGFSSAPGQFTNSDAYLPSSRWMRTFCTVPLRKRITKSTCLPGLIDLK